MKLVGVLHAASATVRFCPMLAILFLSLRLRAQQITHHTGNPQGWAQDAMYICTGTVLLQLLGCLLVGLLARRRSDMLIKSPAATNDVEDTRSAVFRKAIVLVQVVFPLVICSSAVAICVAMFVLTPRTANTPGFLRF